jgi:tetratricopeptide (TPR) repeat protein
MITLAESLALSGDLSRFWALAQDVKDQEKMRHYLSVIAHHLVVAGRIDEAHQIVARLDSEAERERAAQQLAWAVARRHDFDMAAQTAAKIQNRGTRNHALEKIIEAQAESGRWDDALTTLDQIAVSDDMDSDEKESVAKDKTALLALILRYRAENVSRPPETPSTDAASRYRALLALWGLGSTIDDVDRARGLADKLTDPEELATAWRGIAWYYAQKDARDEALDALSRGTAAARKIAEPFAKSLNLVLLADIYLELGDRESAVSLIPEALSSEENMMKLMRGLTSFTTGPAIIGVLVRSGHTDRALQMLHAAKSEPATSWIAFGEFCAETRQLDLAASLLKEQGTATSKAWLALGVATILITDRGKAVKPTAPNDAK